MHNSQHCCESLTGKTEIIIFFFLLLKIRGKKIYVSFYGRITRVRMMRKKQIRLKNMYLNISRKIEKYNN